MENNSQPDKYLIQIGIFTWKQTLQKSDEILNLAERHSDISQALSACAFILLSSALDQGVRSAISIARSQAKVDGEPLIHYDQLEKAPFLTRVMELPKLLTNRSLYLDPNNPHTKALKELVHLRNALLHISEDVKEFTESDSRVTSDEDHLVVRIPKTENPWDSVPLDQAHKFREAVGVYFREVLDPEKLVPGEIISRLPR